MRIAFLAQTYPPMVSGASMVMEYLAREMATRGHEVCVITASDLGPKYVAEKPSLRVLRLKSSQNPLRVHQRYIAWPYRHIFRELSDFQPDIIHMHDPLAFGLAGILAGKKLRIPMAITAHQLPWFITSYLPPIPWLKSGVESILWEYCRWLKTSTQLFISPSATIATTIEDRIGFRPVVIGNGIDTVRFSPQAGEHEERERLCRKYKLDPNRPVILHVGRLDLEKKVDIAIKAAAKAMRNSDAQLLVVGDGHQRAQLIQLTEWLGIQDRSHFPGFVSANGDLPGLYRLASVFVTASEIEIHPLVLLEAMSAEIPIVATRATSIPEIVRDGVNGYLVPPRDTDAMAQRLVDVITNPALAKRMGLESRNLAQHYSLTRFLDQHEASYVQLAQHRRAPRRLIPRKMRKLHNLM